MTEQEKSKSGLWLLRKSMKDVKGYIKKTGKLVYNYERNWNPKWHKVKEGQHTTILPNGRWATVTKESTGVYSLHTHPKGIKPGQNGSHLHDYFQRSSAAKDHKWWLKPELVLHPVPLPEERINELADSSVMTIPSPQNIPVTSTDKHRAIQQISTDFNNRYTEQNPLVNTSMDCRIKVSVGGLTHFKNFTADARKWALLGKLEDVLRDSIYLRSELPDSRKDSDPNKIAYHKLGLLARVGDKPIVAVITVQEDSNGDWIYNADVEGMEIKEPVASKTGLAENGTLDKLSAQRQAVITLTQQMLAHNDHLTKSIRLPDQDKTSPQYDLVKSQEYAMELTQLIPKLFILRKSHIDTYTRHDGTIVQAHENKVTSHSIGPYDKLEPGTEVQIGNKRGKVLKHKVVQAHPAGTVVLHTVQLTHKRKILYGMTHKWIEMSKPEKWEGNYSFVTALRKSQMGFDFSAPAGNAHDHHVAYSRTNASGTVSQIQAKGAATLADRQRNAMDRFEQSLQTIAGITQKEAARVMKAYIDNKMVKIDSVIGQITPKHGSYLDKEMILNAVRNTTPEPWQQTKEEFGNDEDHGIHVFRALQQGKPVPAEVKAQYPELSYLTRESKKHVKKSLKLGLWLLRKSHNVTDEERDYRGRWTGHSFQSGDDAIKVSRTGKHADDFILFNGNPNLSILPKLNKDYGYAYPQLPIRLKVGRHKSLFGEEHLGIKHALELEGYKMTAAEYVYHVIKNTSKIYEINRNERKLLLECTGRPSGSMYVQLREQDGIYSVVSLYDNIKSKNKGNPVWSGRNMVMTPTSQDDPFKKATTTNLSARLLPRPDHRRDTKVSPKSALAALGNQTNLTISNSKNEINKPLRSGLWLRRQGIVKHSKSNSVSAGTMPAVSSTNRHKRTSTHDVFSTPIIFVGKSITNVNQQPVEHFGISRHNTLQKSELPSDRVKTPEQNDIRKAHVAAYDRTTLSGAMAHVEAHEDSRVRRYALKLARTNNLNDLHKLRQERFAHLPHWGSMDENTKQRILDAEDATHAEYKHWDEWKAKHLPPKKAKGKQADTHHGGDKIDRSGWEQSRLFKAIIRGIFLLRKSKEAACTY